MTTEILLGIALGILSFQDLKRQQISLWVVLAAAGCGMAVLCLQTFHGWPDLMCRLLPGLALLLASLLSRGRIGIGDGMVFLVCGLYLSAERTFGLVTGAVLAAAAVAAVLLLTGKKSRDGTFAFVPCVFAVHLFGMISRLF